MPIETIKCRECGSSDVSEFKLGSYVCRHCEAVFKYVAPQPPGTAAACVVCGADSVATCSNCGRRVCNRHMVMSAVRANSPIGMAMVTGLHPVRLVHPSGDSYVDQTDSVFWRGYASGPPRCHQCRQESGTEEEAREEQRARQFRSELADAPELLRTTNDPREITRLLGLVAPYDYSMTAEDFRGAWARFNMAQHLPPDRYVVTVRCRRAWRRDVGEERGRTVAWSCEGGLLVDGNGGVWRSGSLLDALPGGFVGAAAAKVISVSLAVKPGMSPRLETVTAQRNRYWSVVEGDVVLGPIDYRVGDYMAGAIARMMWRALENRS